MDRVQRKRKQVGEGVYEGQILHFNPTSSSVCALDLGGEEDYKLGHVYCGLGREGGREGGRDTETPTPKSMQESEEEGCRELFSIGRTEQQASEANRVVAIERSNSVLPNNPSAQKIGAVDIRAWTTHHSGVPSHLQTGHGH